MIEQYDAPINHQSMPALLARLGGVRLYTVQRHPRYSGGRCYWNVKDHIAANGGDLLSGWMVIEARGLFLVAWHHAIWKTRSGDLVDISAHPQTEYSPGVTTFVEDARQSYCLTWPPGLPQIFEMISNNTVILGFISAYRQLFDLQSQKMAEIKQVKGAYYSADDGLTHVSQSNQEGIEQFVRLNQQYDPIIDYLDRARLAYIPQLAAFQQSLKML